MLAWLLIIFGFVISCFIVPPIGPIVYLVGLIIFFVTMRILKASVSTSAHALNTMANKTSEMPAWLYTPLSVNDTQVRFWATMLCCQSKS